MRGIRGQEAQEHLSHRESLPKLPGERDLEAEPEE